MAGEEITGDYPAGGGDGHSSVLMSVKLPLITQSRRRGRGVVRGGADKRGICTRRVFGM